ncbi:putative cystine transporter YijE [Nocardioides aquaticus]|uniref:Cystine transporter YijE n=1 Tax=Nocardioides aquaticus TaxID=160826 RepID=A0ABX8EHC8_9ACTN|nr:DMT family transporter [Nocardioides aquaticus]QVT78518.1 putative cystine transporter YijE [Nocardioides aquaticus]
MSRPAPSWLPLAAVGCTLVLWASAFVAIRHLGRDFSPGALSLGRLLVGSLTLGVVVAVTRRRTGRALVRPTTREALALAAIGVLWFGVYNVALNEGELRVDAGTAAMLIQVSPVLIALLAALFLGERFTGALALGLALAFGGVVLIALAGPADGDRDVLGVALVLLAAVVYAVSLVLQKPLVRRLPALQVTWAACTVGALVCLPWAGDLLAQVRAAPTSSVWWVVYLGVFPTALAFTTYAYALGRMDASRLGVTTYLVPPITIVLGLLLLGEAPPALAYAGGVLALVGVAVARRGPAAGRKTGRAPVGADPVRSPAPP